MVNTMNPNEAVLEVNHLQKYFPTINSFRKQVGVIKAVDDFSITVGQGETVGLVGESGCGKSTAARTIMRLIEPTAGSIIFQGQDITKIKGESLRCVRKEMQMVFQDPYASLNPKMMVGHIISEPVRNFTTSSNKQLEELAMKLLEQVGLAGGAYYQYPHEFSGGGRQRIGLARALALGPKLIVADEPVSALDVSVQSQVLNLMQDLKQQYNLSYLFISHDLSVVKHISDRIGVMYLGGLVEWSGKNSLYTSPLHPYTQSLLSAIPVPDPGQRGQRIVLEGEMPSPANPPSGCAFHPRCRFVKPECKAIKPLLQQVAHGHQVACHLYTK